MFSYSSQIFEMTLLFKGSDISDYVNISIVWECVFEIWLTMIHNEEYPLFWKPSFFETIAPEYPDNYSLEQYSSDNNKKSIDENKSRNEYSFIWETIGHIEDTNSYEKTHKNWFYHGKTFFDNPCDFIYRVEFLEGKNGPNNTVCSEREAYEVPCINSTRREAHTRDEIGRHTNPPSNPKRDQYDDDLKGDTN